MPANTSRQQPAAVVAIGQLVVDLVAPVGDEDLARLGLAKGRWQTIGEERLHAILAGLPVRPVEKPGGSAANTLVALAHLGVHTRLIGSLGCDDLAQRYLDSLRLPVGSTGSLEADIRRHGSPTGRVLCLITPDAERTMLAVPGASLELQAGDLQPEQFAHAQYVHLTGYIVQMGDGAVLLRAAELAHQAGAKVSFDLAATPLVETYKVFFQEFCRSHVDVLLANEEEVTALVGGTQAALREMAGREGCLIVKQGVRGAMIADGPMVRSVPAESAQAVDTTGAGDAFDAGFLFGALYRLPPFACARLGVALAARLVEVTGARFPEAAWPDLARSLRGLAGRLTKAQRGLD